MNVFARMIRAVSAWWGALTKDSPLYRWLSGEGSDQSDSGVEVTGKSLLSYAPMWYLVSKIAGHVAQMPCNCMEKVSERENKVAKHPAQRLVKYRASGYVSADVFREVMQSHALTWGNGRAAILRNQRNDPTELIILLPDRTVTVLVNGEKWHVVTILETGEKVKISDADVLHIIGLGFDGIAGYSLIEMAKNSIGLGLASEKAANVHFKNNGQPGMVLEAPKGTFRDEKEAKEFMVNWNTYHNGVDNASKAALMREGMKATALSMRATDSQWIEQRTFQRQEAALWMVCEQILGDDSSVSYNSLEQKNLAYLTNCLNRWLVRWELELREKLLTGQQKRQESHYFKFNRNALLAMSAVDRAEFYTKMRAIEALSANEVREKEDLPPVDGGDTYDNPAINPKQPPGDAAATPPEPKPDKAMSRLRQVIVSRLTPLAGAERRVVEKAAATEKNFCAWLESYYTGDAFQPQFSRAVQECGGASAQATAWCMESKSLLLCCAGKASASTLGDCVSVEMGTWGLRVERLADELIQEPSTERTAA